MFHVSLLSFTLSAVVSVHNLQTYLCCSYFVDGYLGTSCLHRFTESRLVKLKQSTSSSGNCGGGSLSSAVSGFCGRDCKNVFMD